MPRFVFSLQPLLEARKRDEESKRLAFGRVRQLHDEGIRELERLDDASRSGAYSIFRAAVRGRSEDLRIHDAHLRFLGRTAIVRRLRNDELFVVLDRAREELSAANRVRRALERLRERCLRAFEREQARRDELELDEANAR